nr:uncharacterized protein LOC123754903 isoform X5 [Procambarus clarkii]
MTPPVTRWLCLHLVLLLTQGVRCQLSVGGVDSFLVDDLDATAGAAEININDLVNTTDAEVAQDAGNYSSVTSVGDPAAATNKSQEETTLPDFDDDLADGLEVTTEFGGLSNDEFNKRTGAMDYEYSTGLERKIDDRETGGATSAIPQLTRRIVFSGGDTLTPTVPEPSVAFTRPSSVVRVLSDDDRDMWLPNWPSQLLDNDSRPARRPTIRFPTDPLPSVFPLAPASSVITPVPSIVPSFTVSKVPVTQYFFDLTSVAPTPVPGPLFDQDDLSTPVSAMPSGRPDLSRPVIDLSSSISDLQSSALIEAARPFSVTPSLFDSHSSVMTKAEVNFSSHTLAATPVLDLVPNFPSTSTVLNGTAEGEVVVNNVDGKLNTNNVTFVTEEVQDLEPETTGLKPPMDHPTSPGDDIESTTAGEVPVDESFADPDVVVPGIDELQLVSSATTSAPAPFSELVRTTRTNALATGETTESSTHVIDPEEPPAAEGAEDGTHGELPEKEAAAEIENPSSSSSTISIPAPVMVTTPTYTTSATKKSTTKVTAPRTTSTSPVSTTLSSEVPTFIDPTETTPSLTTMETLLNGTVVKRRLPFIRALVAYSSMEFCQHKNNFRSLFAQWLSRHLHGKVRHVEPHDIEFFSKPDCAISKPLTEDRINRNRPQPETDEKLPSLVDNEKTNVYFYVTSAGKINPNLTKQFPLFPMDLEISKNLTYLISKVSQLEVMTAKDDLVGPIITDPLHEKAAAVGTSIIVIIVVCSIVGVTIIVALLFFSCPYVFKMVVKRRGATNNYYGRRCTPVSMDAYSMDSVSVYRSFRRKSKRRASGRSVKSYLNQAFDDPNGPTRLLNFAKLTHFISDIDGVYEEFGTIPVNMPKYDELPSGVEDKNRYANVIPVPETRVLLKQLKDSRNSEYINANYVRGARNESKYYIATQAPLDDTVADFWRMIWEQETKVVVMLTDFVEKGIDKCADYLPPSETLDCHRLYGDFQVTLKSRDMREKFVVSNVQLKNLENNLVREVAHMWFTGWPASGVPNEETAFISFILDVRRTRKKLRAKGPIVIHCSPGTGRTGTLLACDIVMRQFEDQRSVDVPRTVYSIRRDRAGAVQTKEQYAFIYRVINFYASKLTSGNLDSL